ncbi:MAG: salt stress protein, Slr1339 family [Waterburya sp.]
MSDKNMDDLLAQLKAEFEPQQPKINAPKPQARKSQPPQKSTDSASMEQMLAELRTELESGRNRPGNPSQQPVTSTNTNQQTNVVDTKKYRDRLNSLIDADYQQQAQKREAKLAEIKRQEEAKIAEQKRRQQELIEAQRREELRERRRKEALREQAQQWLKNLSLNSEEGRWFEEFSYSYESKLEAAIDYLEAMRETGL